MRRTPIAAMLVAILLVSCGETPVTAPTADHRATTTYSGDLTGRRPPREENPLGAGVVAMISFSGGNAAESAYRNGVPEWIAYTDGTVIQPAPWGGWDRATIGRADPDELRSILDVFMASPGHAVPLRDDLVSAVVTDAGSVTLTFTANGGTRSVSALDFPTDASMGLPADVVEARNAFVDVLADLRDAASGDEPWRPSAMMMSARPSDGATGVAGRGDWPLDAALLVALAGEGRCVTLTGSVADELMDITTGPYDIGDWTTPDGTYVVSTQPVLPGRPVC
ncbi:hypothetical protein [Nakamurella deserti]|uniref:hypothetical protein n=1 Tax=Nakamurella deserti TaxID=2164074 RepID=UPI000DBE85CC|nr:hypothetical protein [Nakamurella deserti]